MALGQCPPEHSATPQQGSGIAPLSRVNSPRLYVIDCGTLIFNRPEEYNLTRDEVADTNMPVPCFLVILPKGILLFDTGLSDSLVAARSMNT
jgi:N-acyl homoserine lactone hydrolase